jgi:hypothetical protein
VLARRDEVLKLGLMLKGKRNALLGQLHDLGFAVACGRPAVNIG